MHYGLCENSEYRGFVKSWFFFTYFAMRDRDKENRSLYRGLRYKEVRYIEVPL